MPTDSELLRQYVEERDQKAFAELVQRYLNFVYASALRRIGGRRVLAEEIAQTVFTGLSRNAARLIDHPTLVGWLYRSTRNVAIDAVRSELRREKLTQQLTTMPDNSSPNENAAEWEQVRPVIDAALDELKAPDREIVLLRFLQGHSFGEIGARLNLTENNARVRAGRALEKLRSLLARRGLTSTIALAAMLAQEGLVAAPADLALSVTHTALAAVPAASVASTVSAGIIQKVGVAAAFAVLGGGLATGAWAKLSTGVSDSELFALRDQNAQLLQVTSGSTANSAVKAVMQTNEIFQRAQNRLQKKNAASSSGNQDHGLSTPRDAFLTYVWAIDTGNAETLRKIISYDDAGKTSIQAIYARMPSSVRAQYSTPEDLIVFFFLADDLLNPAPGSEVAEKFIATETTPGHAVLRPPGVKAGGMNWVQTADGWHCIVPADYCDALANRVLGNQMLAKLGL